MGKQRAEKSLVIGCYIAVLVVNALITKYLINGGIDGSFILFNRGLVCLVIVLIASLTTGKSLIPKKPWIQIIRFFVAGLSLICITNSFKFANAASISLVQRSEVLIVIVVSAIISKKFFNLRVYYSLLIIIAAIVFLFQFENPGEENMGIYLALIGTSFVVTGYFLIKNVVTFENYLVITFTSSFGAMIFGLSFAFFQKTFNYQLRPLLLGFLFLLGVLMFLTYRLTTYVYLKFEIETAQYFSFLAIVSIMPIEYFVIGSNMSSIYAVGLVVFSALITAVIFIPGENALTDRALPVEHSPKAGHSA